MASTSRAVIVGASETARVGVVPDMSSLALAAEAARLAVADAGLTMKDVDGVATAGLSPVGVAHHLGINPAYLDGTAIGGCSYVLHIRHAVAAVAAGLCEVVVVTHGQSGRSRIGAVPRPRDAASPLGQFEHPYGTVNPPTMFPIGVLRYMKEFGLTAEQLAMVAVAQRRWSSQVPRAMYRDLITVEDVFKSRLVAYPMHLLECCLVTDGGGAVVVTSVERARALPGPKPPVHILGSGEASETPMVSMMKDFTSSEAFRISSANAFAESGLSAKDIDHFMSYDAFAHLPIYALEDCGLVPRGEAGAFISDGNTSPGGILPMNTNGGGLSYTHTGMYGMFLLLESICQLRGEAAAQVEDVNISMVQGVGGMFESAGTLILGTSETVRGRT